MHKDSNNPAVYAGYLIKFELDRSRILPEYAFRYTQSPQYHAWVANAQRAVAQPNINAKQYAALQIPLPPLDEQRRIAAILDHADAIRGKRRQVIARLDELVQATFLDMFGDPFSNPMGWPLQTLGSIALKFSDGPFGSNLKSSHYVPDGIRVVRLQNIGVGEFIDADRAFISPEHFAQLTRHECRPGDVLVGTLGDPNLRACVQPDWLDVALNKADCVQVRVDPSHATPKFVSALFNATGTLRRANALVLGQTRSRISMGRLRDLKVPVPPISLQLDFDEHIRHVAQTTATAKRAAEFETALFASLQSRAFSGQL
ncbi:MAG: restriction endonuclease subunit S [Sciscionella sp.]